VSRDDVERRASSYERQEPSRLLDHGAACCREARRWFVALDASMAQLRLSSPAPAWIREQYEWGPSPWPLHWCEALGRDTLDSGALALLYAESFAARGLRVYQAQTLQLYSAQDCEHWGVTWEGRESGWIHAPLVYREVNVVIARGGEASVWDPAAGGWVGYPQPYGYAGILALRVASPGDELIRFRGAAVPTNQWHFSEELE